MRYERAGGSGSGGGGGGGGSNTYAVAQVAHGLSVGDIVRVSGANTYAKAQANTAANAEAVGIVTVVADADNFTLTTGGIITTGVPVATAGTVYFLSGASAGALTATEPTTAGYITKPLLVVIQSAAVALFFNLRGAIINGSSAGSNPSFAQKSANYTLTTADHTIEATSGTFTLTLPTAVGNTGTGVVTIDADGSETINGDLTVDMYQYDSVTLVSNGTGWLAWV